MYSRISWPTIKAVHVFLAGGLPLGMNVNKLCSDESIAQELTGFLTFFFVISRIKINSSSCVYRFTKWL